MEPYEGRTAASVRTEVRYILDRYGTHPAFLRMRFKRGTVGKRHSAQIELPWALPNTEGGMGASSPTWACRACARTTQHGPCSTCTTRT